jgi:NAD(P)-dependent dehydrogenase (short-subunit alcohol dehydrogenase family)
VYTHSPLPTCLPHQINESFLSLVKNDLVIHLEADRILTPSGATNGIGLDTTIFITADSPNNHVIMGARNPAKAEARIKEVQAKSPKGTLSYVELDQNSDESIRAAAKKIEQEFGRLDILVNNAAICEGLASEWTTRADLRETFETNVFGPMILTETLIPLLKASNNPMIINVTSGLGSISGLDPDIDPNHVLYSYRTAQVPGYRMSKAALNMLTVYQHAHLRDFGFKVWAYCPGYVVTDLNSDRDHREQLPWCESSETSAQGILDIVRGERDGESGKFITKRGGAYPW